MAIEGSKIYYKFDPWEVLGIEKPKTGSREARQEMADFLHTEILDYVGSGKSPVAGGAWKRSLSKEYKKRKADFSSDLFANMELTGDMLDSLQVVATPDGMIEVRIKGKNAAKADGHNNHSGKSRLPPREFIPKQDQHFKRSIESGMRDIAREFLDDE
jgi:hypothetical protein